MMRAATAAIIGGEQLPYTPIYGVSSDGTAYAVLSHVHQTDRAKVVCKFRTTPSFVYRNSIFQKNLFGCTTNDALALLTNYNDGRYNWEWQLYSDGSVTVRRSFPQDGLEHTATCEKTSTSLSMYFDDAPQTLYSSGASGSITLGRLGVLTQNNYGPGDGVSPMPNRVPKNVAILAFEYWDGDTLCAELVPCIDNATSEVCFYNRADGQFVRNLAGAGAFQAWIQ